MSRAYYYCRNFTFAEVNNLYAFGRRDPSVLSAKQKIIRLYRAALRKQLAKNIHCIWAFNTERFANECRWVREDFDKIWNSTDEKEQKVMMEKYFLFIEQHFDPFMPMHASRKHSNLWGKGIQFPNWMLENDPFGYFSGQKQLAAKPSEFAYYEDYPLMLNAWSYDVTEADENTNLDLVENPDLENPKSGLSDHELKVLHDRHAKEMTQKH